MSYLGSKGQAGVFQRIIGNMPPHSVYVEPFFGSGKIFFTKRPADRNVICDADAGVIKNFNEHARNQAVATRAICGDAISLLPTMTLPAAALIYCDPPYLHSTRTSRHRYKFEMTDDQHARLLTLLKAMRCRVMISGYPSKLYSSHLRKWRCCTYRTRTRGRTVTECLWCNFPEPTQLHDWRFIGKNFRERLTLKRFAARFASKLERMTELRRNFIFDLVHQRHEWRLGPAVNARKGAAR
jgi:DNA adenine methylase